MKQVNREKVSNTNFDTIVIGGGVGGLSAAAMLAKAGKKVLLVEKEPRLGGLIAPVVSGPYQFDATARLLMGCNADGPFGPGVIYSFVESLGIRDQVKFIPLQPIANALFPGSRFQVRSGRQHYIDGLRQIAPVGLENLPPLLDLCSRIYRETMRFTRSGKSWAPWRAVFTMPNFVRYTNATAEAVLSHYVPDQRARRVVAALWPYIGIPLREASFVAWATMMAAYIEEGAWFCAGGLHRLGEAIGSAFIRDGGEIRLNCAAKRVLVRNRKVTGVELADGQRCFAPAVIANIDPRPVFGEMMDPAESPSAYRNRLGRLIPAAKGMSVSLVTDLDLPAMAFDFENLIYDAWDEDQVNRTPVNGQAGFISMTITTIADPGLAPPGQHLVNLFAGLPLDAPLGPTDVHRYSEIVMGVISNHIPELKNHLLLSEGYMTRAFGPIYGWKATPGQAGLGRPDLPTPVKGLILAGQWTRPIQGVMPAILSGSEAARIILRAS